MLQQLPQASHSLKNLLEEEWNFTKVITPYIRGGEAQSGRLFWSVGRTPMKNLPDATNALKLKKNLSGGGILSETAATSPECCSSPPASSSKLACRRAATNSGKAPMTARRRTRSGKEGILKGHYAAVYVLHVLIYVFLFILLLNMFKKNKIKLKLKALGHRDEPVAEGAVPRGEGAGVQGPRLC